MRAPDAIRSAVVLLVAAVLLVPCGAAVAAEEAPGKLTDVWTFWPKPGHAAEFEAAVKTHLAWRKGAGEPFRWTAYQPVVGDDLTYYTFRSGGHHWKDLDAQASWQESAGSAAKFIEEVAPHLARMVHHFSERDDEHSHWTDSEEYKLFGVTTLRLKPGSYDQMNTALTKIHEVAVEKSWPRSYRVFWSIGGDGAMIVANPYKSYAEMADPEPPFSKVLAEALGSEDAAKAVFKELNSSFESASYTVYAVRPDLSTPE